MGEPVAQEIAYTREYLTGSVIKKADLRYHDTNSQLTQEIICVP